MLPTYAVLFGLLAGVAFANTPNGYEDGIHPLNAQALNNTGGQGDFGVTIGNYNQQPRSAIDRQGVSVDCGQSVRIGPGDVYEVNSPNYPRSYPNRNWCQRKFTVAEGTELVVECSVFRTRDNRQRTGCARDFVRMLLGGSQEMRFCGRDLDNGGSIIIDPHPYEYEVDWTFKSNRRGSERGFSCSFVGQTYEEPTTTTTAAPPTNEPTQPTTTTTTSPPGNPDCECGIANAASRIVNGEPTEENEYPWQVVVYTHPGGGFCGGTIINKRYVMTAAHCTHGSTASEMYVKVGEHKLNEDVSGERWISTRTIHEHVDYNPETTDMDFAILELSEDLEFTDKIRPACLPENDSDDYVGVDAVVSGWGTLSSGGQQPNVLQETTVRVTSNQDCGRYPRGAITDNMMCATNPGTDSCQGDSGGPLTTVIDGRYTLIGVVSWGYGCAMQDYPGVYARMTRVLPWVEATTQSGNTCYPTLVG